MGGLRPKSTSALAWALERASFRAASRSAVAGVIGGGITGVIRVIDGVIDGGGKYDADSLEPVVIANTMEVVEVRFQPIRFNQDIISKIQKILKKSK